MTTPRSSANTRIVFGIALLTLATAGIHLQLNFPDPVFILNGLGYLTLLAALYLPVPFFAGRKDLVRWALVVFTAITIIMWVLLGERTILGYTDKIIEVALISLLLIEGRRMDSPRPG